MSIDTQDIIQNIGIPPWTEFLYWVYTRQSCDEQELHWLNWFVSKPHPPIYEIWSDSFASCRRLIRILSKSLFRKFIRILSKPHLLQQLLAVLADPLLLVVAGDVVPHLYHSSITWSYFGWSGNWQTNKLWLIREMNQASLSEHRVSAAVGFALTLHCSWKTPFQNLGIMICKNFLSWSISLTVSSCQRPVARARQLSSVPRTVSDFLIRWF